MRRLLLLVVLAAALLPTGRHAGAVPRYGHSWEFYGNSCGDGPYLYRSSPGTYLGSDYYDCSNHVIDGIQEHDLTGSNNWKSERVIDCHTGETISEGWYIGGATSWTPSTPGECVWGG
jgi:hypothetical protein